MRRRIRPLVAELVRRAQEQGTLRPDFTPQDVTLLFWGCDRAIELPAHVAPEVWRRQLGFLLDGLRAAAATPLPHPPLSDEQLERVGTAGSAAPLRGDDVHEREIRIATPDGDMTTFVVHPDGDGPWPVAVLFMDGVGYREQVKDNARRFAAAGYWCVAPDLFHRAGEGLTFDFAKAADETYRARLMEVVSSVTPDAALADTEAVLPLSADDPAAADGPAVCVGYCMGAKVALHAASALPDTFVAAAGIHPSTLVTDGPTRRTTTSRRCVASSTSPSPRSTTRPPRSSSTASARSSTSRASRASSSGSQGVSHGFAMADLPVYDRAAAERHFERTLDLWRRTLSAERHRGMSEEVHRQHYNVTFALLALGGDLLRAAAVAGRAGAARHPARAEHVGQLGQLGAHRVPAERVDLHAADRPARRHVRQGAAAGRGARRCCASRRWSARSRRPSP